MFWVITALVFIALISLAVRSNHRKDAVLRAAPGGSTRVETVKQVWVNQTVAKYAAAGWSVTNQSSAKSLGSQARVTMTFRKN